MSQILIVAAAFIGAFAPPAEKAPPPRPAAEKFSFKMKNVPWDEVLEWYSNESGLTPIYNVKPTGKFTFIPPTPDAKYTLEEITDILNEAMIQQKFILVRRKVSFTILPSDEKFDDRTPWRCELSDGKTELVQVLIPLTKLAVEEVAPEVRKMLTPYGSVSMLTKTNTLVVFDTAGNLRRIVKIIEDAEGGAHNFLFHRCLWKKAQAIADDLKVLLTDKDSQVQLYDDPYGRYSSWDPRAWGHTVTPRGNTISITVDAKANTLTIVGPPQKIAMTKKIIDEKDRLPPGVIVDFFDDPELRKYSVAPGTADSNSKKLLADFPGLRVIALPSSDEILVLAEPEVHKAVAELLKALAAEKKLEQKKFMVQFKRVPWADVLAWYAKETGLKDASTAKPEGNVTIQPPKDRQFTLGEVSDLINEALTQQKLILIRGEKSFAVVPTDEKIDPKLIPRIELSELPHRGKTELVEVLMPLKSLDVEDTAPEVKKLLTPLGTVSMLRLINALVVTDTAGNINRVYQTLRDCDKGSNWWNGTVYHCQWKTAQYVADILQVALTDTDSQPPAEPYYDPYRRGAADPRDPRRGTVTGRVRGVSITVDAKANTLCITAPVDKLALARRLVEVIDKQTSPNDKPLAINEPELRKYPVPAGTAEAVAKKLKDDYPDLRVIALPTTNEILVLANRVEHIFVRLKLRALYPERKVTDNVETAIIPVDDFDPVELAKKLAKIFPSINAGEAIIKAHVGATPGIIVRGTPSQIEDVRAAVKACVEKKK